MLQQLDLALGERHKDPLLLVARDVELLRAKGDPPLARLGLPSRLDGLVRGDLHGSRAHTLARAWEVYRPQLAPEELHVPAGDQDERADDRVRRAGLSRGAF